MPIFDFKCPKCESEVELLVPYDEEVRCSECKEVMEKQPAALGTYRITGNNSASITPKKFRGGR